jgi:hypothetical protein
VKSISEIARTLRAKGESLRPVRIDQIKEIESEFQIVLPQVYKEFLLLMGRGAGNYMKGSSIYYPDVFQLHEATLELILENQLPPLPPDAFVFWMHQGYQSAYFRVNEGDDPPVYYYSESQDWRNFILKEARLTDFFVIQFQMSY